MPKFAGSCGLAGIAPLKDHIILMRLSPNQHKPFEKVLLLHGASRPKRGKGLCDKEKALIRALSLAARLKKS